MVARCIMDAVAPRFARFRLMLSLPDLPVLKLMLSLPDLPVFKLMLSLPDLPKACHYRRIFVQGLSLSAYICPRPVTIGVYFFPRPVTIGVWSS